ncbi:MAG: hypothetical protein HKN91_03660 [Acidimicrobiia bacterium]|nr:hypothetical protein [Acidimicrobiia bacterium]
MGRSRRRYVAVLFAIGLMAAACDSSSQPAVPTSVATSTIAPTTSAAPPTTAVPVADVDRLLVVGEDGNVITMRRDGSDVSALTDDAGSVGYFQPIWSPDASAVSVSRFDGSGFSLVRYETATGATATVPTQANAFYVYWSPDGSQVGYLSTGGEGMGLSLASFDDESAGGDVELGQPFYFDWSPSGDRLVTLVGEQRFDVRAATAGADPTEVAQPGAFQNPVWSEAGLFYVRTEGGAEQVVLGEPGGEVRVLAVAPAPLIMTASGSGDRLAVQATGNLDGVEASFQAVPTLPLNRLAVLEVATGEVTQVTNSPAAAYFWDPMGEKLLVLGQNFEERRLAWSVWADGELTELTEFLPSRVWADTYLPFFGQYALSTTMWSPDGTAFAFPGLIGELGGIYVQDIAGGNPVYVSGGNWVLWSPR